MPTVKKQSPRKKKVKAKSTSVVDRITSLGDSVFDQGMKVNIYGRSGTGKTTFWATFPKPILAIIASGGKRPGELLSINTTEYRDCIKQVHVESSADLQEISEYCRDNPEQFATVVLDHATGIQDIGLKEVLDLEEIPEQLSWGLATQQQYGQVALQTKERLRRLLDLTQNVVIIAQEREFDSGGAGDLVMPYVGSALTPSVTGWLNPACDVICQTFIRSQKETKVTKIAGKTKKISKPTGKVEYCLRVSPDPVYTTKIRRPKGSEDLPDVLINPTYADLLKLTQ